MENVDVLFSSGAPTGTIKSRTSVHKDGDWHRTVHLWVADKSGHVLIQRRSDNKEIDGGKWDVACAGHVLAGEDGPKTVIREAAEELGLKVILDDLEYLFSVNEERHAGGINKREIHDVFMVVLASKLKETKFVIQESEVSEIRILHYSALKERLDQGPTDFCDHREEYERVLEALPAFLSKSAR